MMNDGEEQTDTKDLSDRCTHTSQVFSSAGMAFRGWLSVKDKEWLKYKPKPP